MWPPSSNRPLACGFSHKDCYCPHEFLCNPGKASSMEIPSSLLCRAPAPVRARRPSESIRNQRHGLRSDSQALRWPQPHLLDVHVRGTSTGDPRGTITTSAPVPGQIKGDFSGLLKLGSQNQSCNLNDKHGKNRGWHWARSESLIDLGNFW